jgi:hypothetical protein
MSSINDKITNITKTLMNQNVLMYGFVGVTTVVLGYYTFFENDIETPQLESQPQPQPQSQPQQQFSQESIQQSMQQPMQSIQSYFSQPQQQQQPSIVGGKNKKKKTRRKQ